MMRASLGLGRPAGKQPASCRSGKPRWVGQTGGGIDAVMRILVIGSGGREHALVWRLARAGHQIVAAPGNPGIEERAECAAIAVGEHARLVELATARQVDLVVVGPEAPLVAGLADKL